MYTWLHSQGKNELVQLLQADDNLPIKLIQWIQQSIEEQKQSYFSLWMQFMAQFHIHQFQQRRTHCLEMITDTVTERFLYLQTMHTRSISISNVAFSQARRQQQRQKDSFSSDLLQRTSVYTRQKLQTRVLFSRQKHSGQHVSVKTFPIVIRHCTVVR